MDVRTGEVIGMVGEDIMPRQPVACVACGACGACGAICEADQDVHAGVRYAVSDDDGRIVFRYMRTVVREDGSRFFQAVVHYDLFTTPRDERASELLFSPDGTKLAAVLTNSIRVWTSALVGVGVPVSAILDPNYSTLAWSSDSARIAAVYADPDDYKRADIRTFDATTGAQLTTLPINHSPITSSLSWGADGSFLLAHYIFGDEDLVFRYPALDPVWRNTKRGPIHQAWFLPGEDAVLIVTWKDVIIHRLK